MQIPKIKVEYGSSKALRALLHLIERAADQKDIATLDELLDIYELLPSEVRNDLYVYIYGEREWLSNDAREWFIHTEDDVAAAKLKLEKVAYGNFDEAMLGLEYDLCSVDRYRYESDIESNVFKPEFFDSDDRKKWDKLRTIMLKYFKAPYNEEQDTEVNKAIQELREYQQKSYGPLIPTMTATYIKRDNDGAHGVTVKLIWIDDVLQVNTAAPFYEELDDYFVNQSPIENHKVFTPACFPKSLGGYQLGDTDYADLFRWEL